MNTYSAGVGHIARMLQTTLCAIPMGLFLHVLGALMLLDTILTYVGVTYQGATELNPLVHIIGFEWFITLKLLLIVPALCICYMCTTVVPVVSRALVLCLVVFYMIISTTNLHQLYGAIV